MVNQELLKKYATLTIQVGVNVQKNQLVVIRSNVECVLFVRELVKAAYEAKAKNVIVEWSDDYVNKEYYENVDEEVLKDVPQYVIEKNYFFTNTWINEGC